MAPHSSGQYSLQTWRWKSQSKLSICLPNFRAQHLPSHYHGTLNRTCKIDWTLHHLRSECYSATSHFDDNRLNTEVTACTPFFNTKAAFCPQYIYIFFRMIVKRTVVSLGSGITVCPVTKKKRNILKSWIDKFRLHTDNQISVQQIRPEPGILVTSSRLDQAATSPTVVHGVKSDEDIGRSLASCAEVSAPPSNQLALRLSRTSGIECSAAHCVAICYVLLLPFHQYISYHIISYHDIWSSKTR